jgi:hypothetical protein
MVVFCYSKNMPGTAHDHFLPNPFHFISILTAEVNKKLKVINLGSRYR